MRFTITGEVYGKTNTITYINEIGEGQVIGDKLILFLFDTAMSREMKVGPVGQYVNRDINNPLAVYCVIDECFEKITKVSGDLPQVDEIQDGCIV